MGGGGAYLLHWLYEMHCSSEKLAWHHMTVHITCSDPVTILTYRHLCQCGIVTVLYGKLSGNALITVIA
jgi:hypothetical protein